MSAVQSDKGVCSKSLKTARCCGICGVADGKLCVSSAVPLNQSQARRQEVTSDRFYWIAANIERNMKQYVSNNHSSTVHTSGITTHGAPRVKSGRAIVCYHTEVNPSSRRLIGCLRNGHSGLSTWRGHTGSYEPIGSRYQLIWFPHNSTKIRKYTKKQLIATNLVLVIIGSDGC